MNNPNPFHHLLADSIKQFHSHSNPTTSNNHFTSLFSRIIQTTPDPPLELLWFYSAVTTLTSTKLDQVHSVKELFNLIVSCSRCSSGVKKVAALSPVLYLLHDLVGYVMFWFTDKKNDVKCLIDGIVSYVCMCCYGQGVGESEEIVFSPLLMDVVSVWLCSKAKVEGCCGEDLRVFFPMVTDEVRAMIRDGREVGVLAGTVICQVFLLSLSLNYSTEAPRAQAVKDLHQQAFQVITGFRDLNFFDTLFRMLLEPTLPVTHLVGYAGESILREVLYDVAMAEQCSIYLPIDGYQLFGHSTEVALRWLLVVDKASHYLRASGDEPKARSYMNSFSESCIPAQLIECVIRKTGTSSPVISTPADLVRWFLAIVEHGQKIINNHTLYTQLQGVASNLAYGHDGLPAKIHARETGASDCNIKFDQEMVDSAHDSCTSSLSSAGVCGQKKRRDRQDNAYLQAKFIKVQCHGNYVKEKFIAHW